MLKVTASELGTAPLVTGLVPALATDVVQVLSQMTPLLQQLAGIDLKRFLQDVAQLPAAAVAASGIKVEQK